MKKIGMIVAVEIKSVLDKYGAGLKEESSVAGFKTYIYETNGCQLIIVNCGAGEIAAAAGTPVAALFGPTRPDLTGPYTERKLIFQPQLTCIYCFKRYCVDTKCHRAIDPDEAAIQSLTLIKETNRS